VLLVSQFTLYGRLKKPKPDFSKAMGPDKVTRLGD
jgi:D-tyrosyl-tRNA(Tyr) deacylase